MPTNSLVRRSAPEGAVKKITPTIFTGDRPSSPIPDSTLRAAAARIRDRLRGRLREVRLSMRQDGVVIRGTANSYHVKQLAQHMVMKDFALPIAVNEISVRSDRNRQADTSPPAALPGNSAEILRFPERGLPGVFDRNPTVLRLIIEQTPVAVIAVDRQGMIQVWNPAATELFGRTQAEAVGQNITIIVPELLRSAHREGFEKAMTNGRTMYGERAVTMRPVLKSGERCFVNFSFAVLRDRDGEVFGAMATARKVAGASAW